MRWNDHIKSKNLAVHTRYFNQGGKRLPGVTTIISGLGWGTERLMKWAAAQAHNGQDPEKVRDEAAAIGTAAHMLIECWLRGETPALDNLTHNQLHFAQQAYTNFLEWAETEKSSLRFHSCEQRVISETYQYGGTADLLLEIDGRFCLADFKTSAGVYESHKIQVAAYALAWNEMYPDLPIEQVWVFRLGRERGEFQAYCLPQHEWQHAQSLFLLLRQVYNYQGLL